jgi:iron complex outermembrane recepter protein
MQQKIDFQNLKLCCKFAVPMIFRISIFIVSLFTVQFAAAQCTLNLSGHITDAETKEHLADATITITELKLTVLSNKKGEFVIKGLCAGVYTILITHSGCTPFEKHIHLKTDVETDIELSHSAGQLGEVVVTGNQSASNTTASNEIKGKLLESTRGLSLAESIKRITGVSVLQTGTNIYKPVIHGLHSQRILILNNGVRQEAQQWGSEHAPEIDPFIANRISVIKGSSALRFGGDAIGGVVLVEPKLLRTDPGISGEVNVNFFSNNRMGVASAMLEGNSAKHPAFSWRLQGTYKRGGNARTPNYWLANSGLEEINFSLAAALKEKNRGVELFYSQFNTRLGIFSGAHIGNVTDLWFAIQSKEPPDYIKNIGFNYNIARPYQQVQHQLLKIKAWKNTGTIGRLNAVVSGQYNNRDEYDQKRFASSSDAPQLSMSISTGIAELVWDHYNTGKWRGTIGTSVLYQNNSYVRRLFIPNYQSTNIGLFVIEKYSFQKTDLEAGLRFDSKQIFNINDNNNQFTYPDLSFNNLSANAGLVHKFSQAFKLMMNVSTAWRAPQVNELYANGVHHGAARIEKGNANLTPERSNNFSANVLFNNSKWDIDAGVYMKQIDGFIFLEPTFPPELTIRGAFPSFSYTQTNARLHGFDVNAQYNADAHWSSSVKASILRAWNRKANDWLIQMPADRYEAQVQYNFSNLKKFNETYISISSVYVLRQNRVPLTGNIEVPGTVIKQSDYLMPPPAYFLLNLEAGTKFKVRHNNCNLILAVTNLTNLVYRDYMNAFRYFSDEMGRNVSLRLKIPFDVKHYHKN